MRFHAEGKTGSNLFAHVFESLHIPRAERHRAVARLLGITDQTLRRYLAGTAEPPPAAVGLLWHESDAARAELDEHAHRGMLYERLKAQGLAEQLERLRARVTELEREADDMRAALRTERPRLIAANASFYSVI